MEKVKMTLKEINELIDSFSEARNSIIKLNTNESMTAVFHLSLAIVKLIELRGRFYDEAA